MMLHLVENYVIFPDDREQSLKALDNFARVFAVLFESWNIDHFNKALVIKIYKMINVIQVTHLKRVVMVVMKLILLII